MPYTSQDPPQLNWEDEPDADDSDYEEEEDPTFFDNVFWRDPIPTIDFDVASVKSVRKTRTVKKKRTERQVPVLSETVAVTVPPAPLNQSAATNSTLQAAGNTTVVHVHHYYPVPVPVSTAPVVSTIASVVTNQAEQVASKLVEPITRQREEEASKRVVLVPFEDSWVTKEEHTRLTYQRELEARERQIEVEQSRIQNLQRTIDQQSKAINDLKNASSPQPSSSLPSQSSAPTVSLQIVNIQQQLPAHSTSAHVNQNSQAISIQDIGPIATVPLAPYHAGVESSVRPGLMGAVGPASPVRAVASPLQIVTKGAVQTVESFTLGHHHGRAVGSSSVQAVPHNCTSPTTYGSPVRSMANPYVASTTSTTTTQISTRSPAIISTSRSQNQPSNSPAITPITESITTSTHTTILSPTSPTFLISTNRTDPINPHPRPSVANSDTTLNLQESLSDLLGTLEKKKGRESIIATDSGVRVSTLRQRVKGVLTGEGGPGDRKEKEVVGKDGSRISRMIFRAFRYFNLTRSVATCCFSVVTCARQLNDPYTIALNAQGLMIALIFFNIVDVLVAFIKAFPKVLWFFWNVKDWDPLIRIYSIWAVIADHELLTDIAPVLINVILKLNGLVETARRASTAGVNVDVAKEVEREIAAVGWGKVMWGAVRKTFHPLISAIFGTYAIYALCAILLVLTDLRYFDPKLGLSGNAGLFLPNSSFFGWSPSPNSTSLPSGNTTAIADRQNVLAGIVWINVVANYAVGAVAGVAYWVFAVLLPGVLGGVRGVRWVERRVGRRGNGNGA
ncbi:hypothetical protein HDU67_007712 [Dinochytrium kinnereticum]|nr:hypothetical protein HDU67_007712 [Dinochytrium kinnereticum]